MRENAWKCGRSATFCGILRNDSGGVEQAQECRPARTGWDHRPTQQGECPVKFVVRCPRQVECDRPARAPTSGPVRSRSGAGSRVRRRLSPCRRPACPPRPTPSPRAAPARAANTGSATRRNTVFSLTPASVAASLCVFPDASAQAIRASAVARPRWATVGQLHRFGRSPASSYALILTPPERLMPCRYPGTLASRPFLSEPSHQINPKSLVRFTATINLL